MDFLKIKQELDTLIRKGRFAEIQSKLGTISPSKIPRQHLAELASLARRAHQWQYSLKWLHPIIRPQVKRDKNPSAQEVLEYALALQKAGSLRESEELLQTLDPNDEPRVLLAQAYLHFTSWNYAKAEGLLSKFVQSPKLPDYMRFIGQVNLLAALVYLQSPEAETLLQNLENELEKNGHNLLLSNCYEISAQHAVASQNWSEATRSLEKARRLVQKEQNLDSMFIEKWQVISEALRYQDPEILLQFRAKAIQMKHWETLRHLDFYHAMLRPESVWANWVYFGTPHLEFRKRLEKVRTFPNQEWVSRGENPTLKLDPWFPDSGESDISHRCLVLLLKDFYYPMRVGEIFSSLFPNQYYNPNSSPNRVHQTMTRFRKWLAPYSPSINLAEQGGTYSLRMEESSQVLCRKRDLKLDESSFMFVRYDFWNQGDFSSQEIAKLMDRPLSSLQRSLKKAVDDGVLTKLGSGRFTTYQLKK